MKWTYQPALDGVRAFAMYLIIPFHAGMYTVGNGFMAVDIFFVLSGFLVTNVMLHEIRSTGRLDIGRFYARRVRRLLPAAMTVVVATAAVFVLISTVVRRMPLVADAQSALLYVANWRFLANENDYFATDVDRSPYMHFWSLAIEEQYYFIFPLLLVGLLALARGRRWVLPVGLTVVMLASLGAQMFWMVHDPAHAYYGTDARLYQLMAGVLLALFMLSGASRRWRPWTAPVGAIALLVLATQLVDVNTSVRNMLATVASLMLVGGLYVASTGWSSRLFSMRIPVYLGQISYGTYLWHWPVLLVLSEFLDARPLVLTVLTAVVGTALAALSFEVVESPVRRARALDGFRWTVLGAGVVASALVAVLVVPPVLGSERRPVLMSGGPSTVLDTEARGGDRRVPNDLDFRAISEDIGERHTCPDDPEDCRVVEGAGLRVVLLGDSKARMLEPMFVALAREHDLDLWADIQEGCPWQVDLRNGNRPPDEQQACVSSRRRWYEQTLEQIEADLVVVVSNGYDNPARHGAYIERASGSDSGLAEVLLETTEESLAAVADAGATAVVVRNIFEADQDPLDCLAAATRESQCLVPAPARDRPTDSIYDVAAVRSDRVFTLDLNPLICPGAPLCRPILGGTVVWRDRNHITAALGVELREQVWNLLADSGALDAAGDAR